MTGSKPLPREEYDRKWIGRVMARSVLGPDGCLLWQGFKSWNGYGSTTYRARRVAAHRRIYELYHGVSVSRWQYVCHTCDRPNCLNVQHLWLGTPKDNARDCARKGRFANDRRTHCPKGHAYTDDNTYVTKKGSRNCKRCGLIRNRVKAGWPPDIAASEPPVSAGFKVVDAEWKHQRERRSRPARTHCKHGHALTEENSYLHPKNYVQCRTCIRASQSTRRLQSKGTVHE